MTLKNSKKLVEKNNVQMVDLMGQYSKIEIYYNSRDHGFLSFELIKQIKELEQ